MIDSSVLIVEDDPCVASFLREALVRHFTSIQMASNGAEALLVMGRRLPRLVISDLRMPGMDGLELLVHIKARWNHLPVIMVTVEQDIATVVEAVQMGVINYLVKPVSPAVLMAAACKALATASPAAAPRNKVAPEIIGSSPAMSSVRQMVSLAARSDVNVLISGETGTGKELVARAIHRLSSLNQGPFVAHNCAQTPSDLFESQFFGHRRGSFSGAVRDQAGLLEKADGGILFLDELECLTLSHQAKLLRVIDDGEVRPMGASSTRFVSVRFLAASNLDSGAMLTSGVLRQDLYYRLCGLTVKLPPLCQRTQDIPQLAAHFLKTIGGTLTPEAVAILQEFSWPGNVRQLKNLLHAAAAHASGGPIKRYHLTLGSLAGDQWPGSSNNALEKNPAVPLCSLRKLERQAIVQALQDCRGNRSHTARILGIDRSTLRRKLKQYDLGRGSLH